MCTKKLRYNRNKIIIALYELEKDEEIRGYMTTYIYNELEDMNHRIMMEKLKTKKGDERCTM